VCTRATYNLSWLPGSTSRNLIAVTLGTWALSSTYATVMTILIRAGATKLASPAVLITAIHELWPGRAPPRLEWPYALGIIEITTAVLLATPNGRQPVLVLLVALGLGFAAAGVLGLIRGARKPCGCFGATSRRPLGAVNFTFGCFFLGFAVLALQLPAPEASTAFTEATVSLAIIGSIVWLLSSGRRSIRSISRLITGGRQVKAQ